MPKRIVVCADARGRTEVVGFAGGEEEQLVEQLEGGGGRLMNACDDD